MLWGVKASCVPVEGLRGLPKAAVPAPPNPSLVSCLHASPSSHQPPWGDNYLSQVLSTGAPASHTGFMFQVSGTWHRAARGPRSPCKHPSLARGHYSPAAPLTRPQTPVPQRGLGCAPRREQARMVIQGRAHTALSIFDHQNQGLLGDREPEDAQILPCGTGSQFLWSQLFHVRLGLTLGQVYRL